MVEIVRDIDIKYQSVFRFSIRLESDAIVLRLELEKTRPCTILLILHYPFMSRAKVRTKSKDLGHFGMDKPAH